MFFTACGVNNKREEAVVARVGKENLTKDGLFLLVGNQAGNADVFSRAISRWVENKLLYRAALSIGLDKDLGLSSERDLFYENLLISSFVKIKIREKTNTTKKEVSDYYLKNKNSFKRTDDEIVVKHFVFPTNKKAKKIIRGLKKKKPTVDMENLLKNQQVETKTIKKTSAGSNLVGYVFDGEVGGIVGPKKHHGKFHVFQILQKHKKGSYIGLEKVYDEIYQRINKEKEILVLDAVLDSLYSSSDVFVSKEILNR